jgi:hypothetical protein
MNETLTWGRDPALSLFDAAVFRESPVRATARPAGTIVGTFGRERSYDECLKSVREFCQLPRNWDRYGGNPAHPSAAEFAVNLLGEVSLSPDVPAPVVRPISNGVFVEWRSGDARLYFEVDDESVLRYVRNAYGEETFEDPTFDLEKAAKVVGRFHRNVAE